MSLYLKNLTICKADGEVLFPSLNFAVQKGDILCLMGPSGCGKSTLLDVIAGHLARDFSYTGGIWLNGIQLDGVAAHQRDVGILFQDDLLFPHLCVWENLAFALPNSIKGAARKATAINALNNISLSKIVASYPDQISGGQRARVSLMRMLLAKPKLALLDEPFNKLDKTLRIQFRDWVVAQLKQANIPALMVTHDELDIPPGSQLLSWPWDHHGNTSGV